MIIGAGYVIYSLLQGVATIRLGMPESLVRPRGLLHFVPTLLLICMKRHGLAKFSLDIKFNSSALTNFYTVCCRAY